ncbi:MAG: hypothetical protein ABIH46_06850 [Chloroflexota bacterium]
MAFGHGSAARFYYNCTNISKDLEQVDPEFTRDLAEKRPLTSNYVESAPGLRSLTIALSGLYDAGDASLGTTAWDAFDDGEPHVFAYLPQGDVRDSYGYCGWANFGSESITAGDDVVRMPVSVIGSNRFSRAVILHPLRVEASSSQATANDNAAASTGMDAYLICTAAAGTITARVEHSSAGATYNSLGSFTTMTAAGEATLVSGVSVNRYVRAAYTVSGSGGTIFVAFARR